MATEGPNPFRPLQTLDPAQPHIFAEPSKRIHQGEDVNSFLSSKAYGDIMTFLLQLNRAMFPSKPTGDESDVKTYPLNADTVEYSEPVRKLQLLLSKLEAIIDQVPPDPGPRRFGNISFRRWNETVEERASSLLDECLPPHVLEFKTASESEVSSKEELKAYFIGGLGSAQRLDYGTGHELSFLAFLACIWKLNGFPKASPGVEERAIVLGVIEPYLALIRRLIKTYTLEPAGSHGVWGLDDHSFIPYIFGSAQYSPAISPSDQTPIEGSLPNTPDPSEVVKANVVERERQTNMYFSAIGFIRDVKSGPFWEHSPMLYDISGIRAGWGKINKGMIKMYNAEVLSKFPVVQHFPFGSLFSWDQDPNAIPPAPSSTPHTSTFSAQNPTENMTPMAARPTPDSGTKAPWATSTAMPPSSTGRPSPGATPMPPQPGRQAPGGIPPTRAPWANDRRGPPSGPDANLPTRAPWAK
ncbi:Serine/threonine-protein phosphatase 2A activator 1 [Arachnomyces sp. PD_36]|nr:Serine/threonine-protein phosphatase 2A activator 1 [Arachnomyces sp. PD_36]